MTSVASYATAALNTVGIPLNLARVVLRSVGSDAVILHNGRFKVLPPRLLVSTFCRTNRGRFRKPSNLEIVLLHNRPYKTLLEQNLEYLGIEDYTVLRPPSNVGWRHTFKITYILDYLRSGRCKAEYLVYADSDDVIFREDPARLAPILEESGCDMLFSSTKYARYHGLTEAEEWARAAVPEDIASSGPQWIHINAGVFLARTSFLREFLEQAAAFVTADDLASDVFLPLNDEDVRAVLPSLPYASGDDQLIFRHIAKGNFPRLKVDYKMRVALR